MYVEKLVYPILLECCQYADDFFWEDIFMKMAFGKPPCGRLIFENFLYCSHNQKEFFYDIKDKDSKIIYNEVSSLLKNHLGIYFHQEDIGKINDIKNWNDIKTKKMKELLIELYVSKMRTKYSLSIKQACYLLSTILIAMALKLITVNDIDYSNGRINKIEGINFSKKQVIITRNLSFTS